MDYRCRLGSLCKSSTSRSRLPQGTVLASYSSGDILFPPLCASLHVHAYFRGRVDDLSFFEYLNPFCFLSIEFHCTFSISY